MNSQTIPQQQYPMLPNAFSWQQGHLCCEGISVASIAQTHGTPMYLYAERAIVDAYKGFAAAHDRADLQICYAVKANPSLGIIRLLAGLGAGFDIVSQGELQRVLAAGGNAERVVFSGVGKTESELRFALCQGVGCINVESLHELQQLGDLAVSLGLQAPVSVRINPDIDAQTHPYISTGLKENKFGLSLPLALQAYRLAQSHPGLHVLGVDCHIGSQITSMAPFLAAADRVLAFVDSLAREEIFLSHIDLGGGLGICYHDETPPAPDALIGALISRVRQWADQRNRPMPRLVFEFGRALVGNAGLLVSAVTLLKPGTESNDRHFAVVDAAMNDLMRPSLYGAWHEVIPLSAAASDHGQRARWDLVGPICESGDWLAKDRDLALAAGDLLAFASAGAYGSAMGSQYNSRPRPPEVLVRSDGQVVLLRRRDRFEDLILTEQIPHGL
jgi:diaminopimelate decarboxylase